MKTPIHIYVFATLLCLAAAGAAAQERVDGYYSDPPYVALGEDDTHPLQELMRLAEEGNERAMYIMADLYEKGKGGMVRDAKKAEKMFEDSAKAGFDHGLIRLAAIARKRGDVLEAYKWYSLALEAFQSRDYSDTYAYLQKRRDDMAENAKMDEEQIKKAKRMMRDWKRNNS